MIPDVDIPITRIRELAGDREFLSAMGDFYARLEKRIADHHPVCRQCGACCRFDDFGHKLYVTPAEVAFFLGTVAVEPAVERDPAACPYWIGGLCWARHSRPMGCRVFFCESAGLGWQEDLTESALADLRTLHESVNLPYAYVEWLQVLRHQRVVR